MSAGFDLLRKALRLALVLWAGLGVAAAQAQPCDRCILAVL